MPGGEPAGGAGDGPGTSGEGKPALRGLYIALEGPEGSGKTTQLERLASRLRGRGLDVVTVREPGSTDLGEQVRRILLDPAHRRIVAEAEVLLFAAARAQLIQEVVEPALREGRTVLSDRSVYASLAYQGFGRGLGVEVVRRVNELATGGVVPDLVLVLDLPPEVGLQRNHAGTEPDRLGQEDLAFHRRVREGYLQLGREDPRVRVVPSEGDPDQVEGRIWEEVRKLVEAWVGG